MKRENESSGLEIIFVLPFVLIVIAIIICLAPIYLLLSPIFEWQNKRWEQKKTQEWLNNNEGKLFLIYPIGNSQESFYQKEVLPFLPEELELVPFNGTSFLGSIPYYVIKTHSISVTNKGLPGIILIHKEKVEIKYFKNKYNEFKKLKKSNLFRDFILEKVNSYQNKLSVKN